MHRHLLIGWTIGLAACGSPPDGQDGNGSQASPLAAASGTTVATGDSRSESQPSYPSVCETLTAGFSPAQRSSPPKSDDTSRLAKALSDCKGTGKSVVLAASADKSAFFSGSVKVDGEALVIDAGVTLYGNDGYSGELIAVTGKNAAIMGPGAVDGRGDLISGTPRLVQASQIDDFVVYDVTLQHAAKEHLYVQGGQGFTAWKLHIATPANTKNTDGIDIDSLTNATVYGSFIEDGDDGIAIKTNSGPCANVTVRGNVFRGTHGMSIGSQTSFGVSNVLWTGNTVYGTDEWGNESTNNNGINIKSDVDCGGPVQQVTYEDTCMSGVKHLIVFNSNYGSCSGTKGTPHFTDIVVNGVYSTDSPPGAYSEFNGYSGSDPLQVALENVKLDVTTTSKDQYAAVGIYDSNVKPNGTDVTTAIVSGSPHDVSCSF